MSVTCDVGIQLASNVTCDALTQTVEVIEEPNKRTDGGAVQEENNFRKKRLKWTGYSSRRTVRSGNCKRHSTK
jgi:hypothetical protein